PSTSTDLLLSLVEKSLVQADDTGDGERRYLLLETFREYGREKLAERGELSAVRDRHRDVFLAVAVEAEPHLTSPHERQTLARLEREIDNLRDALAWSMDDADDRGAHPPPNPHPPGANAAIRIAAALWRFWFVRGHLAEGRRVLSRAVEARSAERTPEARMAQQHARYGLAQIMSHQGDYRAALAQMETYLASARAMHDQASIAEAFH